MTRSTPALIIALLLSPSAPAAFADTYDYAIDRFEADGNIHGPLDGTPDLLEEFDDGTMGPLFGTINGTAVESSGALHLKSPGLSVAIPGVTPVPFETSAAVSSGFTGLQVGGGDMVLRIVLPQQTIGGNDAVNLLVSSIEGTALYYTGVSIANFNTAVTERLQPGLTPGLSILSHREEINYTNGNEQLTLEQAPITEASITGDIVLELRYDDAAQALTPAYSLDGGATFAAPFAPLPVESASGTAQIYIAAVAYAGECPATFGIQSLRLRRLANPGLSGMTMSAAVGGDWLAYKPTRFLVTDDGAAGATVFDVQLPLLASTGCDPRDGWSGGHSIRRYSNFSNAMPPGCVPGSAHGLQLARMRWTGTNYLKLKVKKGSMPQVVGPLRVGIYSNGGPVNECDGYVATTSCLVGAGRADCLGGP
jgi:hypothetical protein